MQLTINRVQLLLNCLKVTTMGKVAIENEDRGLQSLGRRTSKILN